MVRKKTRTAGRQPNRAPRKTTGERDRGRDRPSTVTETAGAAAKPTKAPPPRPTAARTTVPPGFQNIDRMFHALQARATNGVSPAAVMNARLDWLIHLANSPGKLATLAQKGVVDWGRFCDYARLSFADPDARHVIEPETDDRRFRSDDWKAWPFNVFAQSFLLAQDWWHEATTRSWRYAATRTGDELPCQAGTRSFRTQQRTLA